MDSMTETCLPCELAATAAEQDVVPESTGEKAAWSGPIGIENQRTGDGRLIETNALRWDSLPVPLRWAMQDFGAHDGAYVVGKIEEVERIDYDEANERLQASGRDPLPESFKDAGIIWGIGTHDMGSEYGREAHRQVDEGFTPGISMDLDDIVVREDEGDDTFTIVEGRVRAATQVAIPAFEGARIATSAVETMSQDEDTLAAEVFNWVDDVGGLPKYIKRISKHLQAKGMTESHAIATAVNVVTKMCSTGDVNFPGSQQVNAKSRSEACLAVAEWEEKKARARANDAETITASAAEQYEGDWFTNPGLREPTGLIVTDEGRVYGHIALWGTCHIANPQGHGVCTEPPSSPTQYAYFNTRPLRTNKGDVYTGRLTMDTLHAGAKLSANDTLHHYEHTGAVAAYVVAGEDNYGIYIAGQVKFGVDPDAVRSAPVSGDWRGQGRGLELMAVLSVNVPGFPIPRTQALVAGGAVKSLVASGMILPEQKVGQAVVTLSDDAVRDLYTRFREMERRDLAAALAAKVHRLATVEKVRRMAKEVGPGSFAYNEDQWRVPKGNPEGGRWIDMPNVGVDGLANVLGGFMETTNADEGKVSRLGESLEKAQDAADRAADALRNNDGDAATAAANEANEALSDVENQLQDLADSGDLTEQGAEDIGLSLDEARNSVDTVANSDLSLLGDDSFDDPDSDIGGEDGDKAPKAESTDIGGGDDKSKDAEPDKAPTVDDPQGEDPLSDEDLFGEAGFTPNDDGSYTDPRTGAIVVPSDSEDGGWDIIDPESGALANDEPLKDANEVTDWLSEAPALGEDPDVQSPGPPIPNDNPADASAPPGMKADPKGREENYLNEDGTGGVVRNDRTDRWIPYLIDEKTGREYTPKDIGDNKTAQEAKDHLDKVNPRATAEDKDGDGKTGDEEISEPTGTEQQNLSQEAMDSTDDLDALIEQAADAPDGIPEEDAPAIGEALDDLYEKMSKLVEGIQQGDYNAADLPAAQNALTQLENLLMATADKPGLSDEQANKLGTALDRLFEDMKRLTESLDVSKDNPVPFSLGRRYYRQWLGRRGIKIGTFTRS